MDATGEHDRKPGAGPAVTPAYFELVRGFPLLTIRDDAHLGGATRVMHGLLEMELDAGGEAYLDALSTLVKAYEDLEPFPASSPAEVLRGLLEGNGMTQAEFAAEVGLAQSTVSALLSGSRKFTAGHAAKLAARFGVPASAFIEPAPPKPRG